MIQFGLQAMSNLNKLIRHKNKQQSQFRVHFYLRGIYYDQIQKIDLFLQGIASRISKIVPIAILQICNSIKKNVDVSVGLYNDNSACNFIESGKKIYLSGQNGEQCDFQPKISDSFKTYYNIWLCNKSSRPIEKQQIKEFRWVSRQSSEPQLDKLKSRNSLNQQAKKWEDQSMNYVSSLWIFCIPLNFKQRQIYSTLNDKGFRVKRCQWKLKQDMEYLQVDLIQPAHIKQIETLELKIQRYPLLVIQRPTKGLTESLMKYQVQLNFEKEVDQIELIKYVDSIGGVFSFIKDQFYGPRKYIVGLTNIAKTQKLIIDAEKDLKYCHACKPRFIMRPGRLQKFFTFPHMVQNVQYYLQQIQLQSQQVQQAGV